MWRVFVYIEGIFPFLKYFEGIKQRNDREDEKSMIGSYATYMKVPAGGMAGL